RKRCRSSCSAAARTSRRNSVPRNSVAPGGVACVRRGRPRILPRAGLGRPQRDYTVRMVDRRTWLQGAALAATLGPQGALLAATGPAATPGAAAAATAAASAADAARTPPEVTAALAHYACDMALQRYPAEVRHQGARTLLNWVG